MLVQVQLPSLVLNDVDEFCISKTIRAEAGAKSVSTRFMCMHEAFCQCQHGASLEVSGQGETVCVV